MTHVQSKRLRSAFVAAILLGSALAFVLGVRAGSMLQHQSRSVAVDARGHTAPTPVVANR